MSEYRAMQQGPYRFSQVGEHGVPTMLLNMPIGAEYNEIDGVAFAAELLQHVSDGAKEVHLAINSPGGDMDAAFNIRGAIEIAQRQGVEVVAMQMGQALSAAGLIAATCNSWVAHECDIVMAHEAQGTRTVEQAEAYNNTVYSILAAKAGKTPEDIKQWLNGTDRYMTAQQAHEFGLVDKVVPSIKAVELPTILNSATVAPLWAVYNQAYGPTPQTSMKMIAKAVGLTNEATEDTIVERIQALNQQVSALTEERNALQAQIAEGEAEKLEAFVENAVSSGKITNEQKNGLRLMAAQDMDAAKAFVEQQPVNKANPRQANNAAATSGIPAERQNWTISDWAKNDPQGLSKIYNSDPDTFKLIKK